MSIGRKGSWVVGTQKPDIGGEKAGLGRGNIVDLGQGFDAISSLVHQHLELGCINVLWVGGSGHWSSKQGIVQGVRGLGLRLR